MLITHTNIPARSFSTIPAGEQKKAFFSDHDLIPTNHIHVDILSARHYCVMTMLNSLPRTMNTHTHTHTHARTHARTHQNTTTATTTTTTTAVDKQLQISLIQFPDKNIQRMQ